MNTIISVDLVQAALRSDTLKHLPIDDLRRDARDYLQFLELAQRTSSRLAPTKAIDEMWHLHMLHPVAYSRDCMRLFGAILDHDGGFGTEAEELPVLMHAFEETAELWEEAFGQPYLATGSGMTKCQRNCVSRCWHRCSTIALMP